MNCIATKNCKFKPSDIIFHTTDWQKLPQYNLLLASVWSGDITKTLREQNVPARQRTILTSTEEPHLLIYHSNNFPFRNMSQKANQKKTKMHLHITLFITALLIISKEQNHKSLDRILQTYEAIKTFNVSIQQVITKI